MADPLVLLRLKLTGHAEPRGRPGGGFVVGAPGYRGRMLVARVWAGFGRLPALMVAAVFYVTVFAVAFLLPEGTSSWVGIGLLVAFVAYCVARPRGGSNVFWSVALPGIIGSAAEEWLGAPAWLGLLLLPLVVACLWDIDREDRSETRAASAPSAGGAGATRA